MCICICIFILLYSILFFSPTPLKLFIIYLFFIYLFSMRIGQQSDLNFMFREGGKELNLITILDLIRVYFYSIRVGHNYKRSDPGVYSIQL